MKKILVFVLLLFSTSNFASANMVELELPKFSKEVRERAADDKGALEEQCTVDNIGQPEASVTCSTGEKPVPRQDQPDESSEYARDQRNKFSRERR